uniref:Uncharacterized protein n=1 Tax=Arundo donax TaxID=35708 RepID=A0A0A9H517_ARUDO
MRHQIVRPYIFIQLLLIFGHENIVFLRDDFGPKRAATWNSTLSFMHSIFVLFLIV